MMEISAGFGVTKCNRTILVVEREGGEPVRYMLTCNDQGGLMVSCDLETIEAESPDAWHTIINPRGGIVRGNGT